MGLLRNYAVSVSTNGSKMGSSTGILLEGKDTSVSFKCSSLVGLIESVDKTMIISRD